MHHRKQTAWHRSPASAMPLLPVAAMLVAMLAVGSPHSRGHPLHQLLLHVQTATRMRRQGTQQDASHLRALKE